MTVLQLLLALRARWLSAALVVACVTGLGIAATALMQPKYTAKASVLLDVKSPDPIAGASMQALAIGHHMATQADVLRSERVIADALRGLGMDKDAARIDHWRRETGGEGEPIDWLVEHALRNLEVLLSRESNIITVAYTSHSQREAAEVVNAIVGAYVATTVALRTDPAKQFSSFFDARAGELRRALEQAQARLSGYQREVGVVSTDERMDIENNRLAELSSELVTAQGAAAEARTRRALGAANAETMPDIQSNPMIASLRLRLADKQLELTTMTGKYGASHPARAAVRGDLESLQEQLNVETHKVLRGIALNSEALQSKVAQLQSALDAQRAKVLQLKQQRDLAAVLKKDVENSERAYGEASTRNSQTSLESQATQTNVSILQQASVPTRPSSPKRLKNLTVSVFFGLLLGVGTAFVRELRDRRLRAGSDVELLLGQRLLGVLPRQPAQRRPFPASPSGPALSRGHA